MPSAASHRPTEGTGDPCAAGPLPQSLRPGPLPCSGGKTHQGHLCWELAVAAQRCRPGSCERRCIRGHRAVCGDAVVWPLPAVSPARPHPWGQWLLCYIRAHKQHQARCPGRRCLPAPHANTRAHEGCSALCSQGSPGQHRAPSSTIPMPPPQGWEPHYRAPGCWRGSGAVQKWRWRCIGCWVRTSRWGRGGGRGEHSAAPAAGPAWTAAGTAWRSGPRAEPGHMPKWERPSFIC